MATPAQLTKVTCEVDDAREVFTYTCQVKVLSTGAFNTPVYTTEVVPGAGPEVDLITLLLADGASYTFDPPLIPV